MNASNELGGLKRPQMESEKSSGQGDQCAMNICGSRLVNKSLAAKPRLRGAHGVATRGQEQRMSLSLVCSEQHESPRRTAECAADCACDGEKVAVVRAYLHERFPTCPIREFHSRSRVQQRGRFISSADHHVISLSDDRPCCAVLTPEFFDQPIEGLAERLQEWHLASAVVAEGAVIVGRNGLSPR
jgi:hypothetical protein